MSNFIKYESKLVTTTTLYEYEHICSVCAKVLSIENHNLICNELAKDWLLSEEEKLKFNFREGSLCQNCKSSVRLRNLAKVILEILNLRLRLNLQNMYELTLQAKYIDLVVAEINHCGILHDYISKLPNLYYSEYGSKDKSIRNENLLNLSYENELFDIVLMSDVLEHVPDIVTALNEVCRVLKKNGNFIFTVPFLLNRTTKTRAKYDINNTLVLLEKASYHGDYSSKMDDHLVFYEFGIDFIDILEKLFELKIYIFNDFGKETTVVFYCKKRTLFE